MQPKIKIVSAQCVPFPYTKNGENRVLHRQPAFFERGDGCTFPINLILDDPSKPFPEGTWDVSPESFSPSRYGLDFNPRPLVPAVSAVRAAASK